MASHTSSVYSTENAIAIIPARSGSQGITDKNIKTLAGTPLIANTIQQAQESKLFDEIFVSTDSEEYAEVARSYGASVPYLRPAHLSGHTVPSSEVTIHTLQTLQDKGRGFKYFAVLQPTSPLRTVKNLQESYTLLLEKRAEVIISVSPAHHPPQWFNILPKDLSMKGFITKEIRNKPRQELAQYYSIHGAVFWADTQAYLANQDPYEMNTYAYIMSHEESLDIDSIEEFMLAEILLQRKN